MTVKEASDSPSLFAGMRDDCHLHVGVNDVPSMQGQRLDHQIALEGPTRLRVVRLNDESCPCPVANSLRQDAVGPCRDRRPA